MRQRLQPRLYPPLHLYSPLTSLGRSSLLLDRDPRPSGVVRFQKYNAVLRGLPRTVAFFYRGFVELCKGNSYECTIHAISRALLKLSRLTKAAPLFRGIGGLGLPDSFLSPDGYAETLVRGGVEFGFMSCTPARQVAFPSSTPWSPLLSAMDPPS